jgi:hypothetical protein
MMSAVMTPLMTLSQNVLHPASTDARFPWSELHLFLAEKVTWRYEPVESRHGTCTDRYRPGQFAKASAAELQLCTTTRTNISSRRQLQRGHVSAGRLVDGEETRRRRDELNGGLFVQGNVMQLRIGAVWYSSAQLLR